VIQIVTPSHMSEIDRAAPDPIEVLIDRAGAATARVAYEMLGGAYGRRVAVIAGKGNNGADGRSAAARLRARGMGVTIVDALDVPPRLDGVDLVIDAAYGTGYHGDYSAPDPGSAQVLAVDIPSGVDGLTGVASIGAVRADRTVTFGALKPGLLFNDGPECAGAVEVADIGLDTLGGVGGVVTDADVDHWVPRRESDAHKWNHAVWVIGGSPGMVGAPALAAEAAFRGGAGYVRRSVPGAMPDGQPIEAVSSPLPEHGWASIVSRQLDRISAVVVGPGLGRSDAVLSEIIAIAEMNRPPTLFDGDALWAIGSHRPTLGGPTMITPHDGEFRLLTGASPGTDRLAAASALAEDLGATVLLKGPSTVVAAPDGRIAVVCAGDERLATAGSGDVLAGLIGALLARGIGLFEAACSAAHLHGLAADSGPSEGLKAGDLGEFIPNAFERVRRQ
jgi:hydroxyethylthiazole kinase-like uncharacterized protein yjeF